MGKPNGTGISLAKGRRERGLTKLNTLVSIYFKACSMIQLNLKSKFEIKLLGVQYELFQAQTEQIKNEYLFVSQYRIQLSFSSRSNVIYQPLRYDIFDIALFC